MTRYLIRRLALMALCAGGLLDRSAFAEETEQNDGANRAAAEALFQQGQQLMSQKRYAEACEKLDASSQLDSGVGTLLYLGDCYEKLGKLASAWAAFEEAASLANARGEAERSRVATQRADALAPRLPQIVVKVEAEVPKLEVRRDTTLVPKASWGAPLPTDPGEYTITATAPGYDDWQQQIQVTNEHEPQPVVVPKLKRSAQAAPAWVPPPAQTVETTQEARTGSGSTQRTVGILVGGAGAVGLIVDGVFSFLAASKNKSSKDHCSAADANVCSSKGVSERDDARSFATVATVSGVVGGIALASGAVIYFTAPRAENGAPQGAEIELSGSF